jgi:adenylate cyclase
MADGRAPRLTLTQLFVVATIALTVLVGAGFLVFVESSRRSIVERSERLRSDAAERVATRVQDDLEVATTAIDDLERDVKTGVTPSGSPLAMEAALFEVVLNNPRIAEATLTHARRLGYDDRGTIVRAEDDRWQLSVYRASSAEKMAIQTRVITRENGRFVAELRARPASGAIDDAALAPVGTVDDPTEHLTFLSTAAEDQRTKAGDYATLWSDLHRSEIDALLPEQERRVVVTAMRAIDDRKGEFLGVLRIGLLLQDVDDIARGAADDDPSRVFLCDDNGRLVSRLTADDPLKLFGDDLRVAPKDMPPEIARALDDPMARDEAKQEGERSGMFDVGGRSWLFTYRPLEHTQDWSVGIVVPEDFYTKDLRAFRDRFLLAYGAVSLLVFALGALTVRALTRSLGRVSATTARMRDFDFAATDARAPFRDVSEVMDGLERAKTVVRALGKYVPIDLVRELYQSNREPVLGGVLADVSIMFTDIEGFTDLSERLDPTELAQALGRYLESMTRAIEGEGGTIDKFIGDAVMALWNVPSPCEGHARRACAAALACTRANRALYESDAWRGLPALVTRFGLHGGRVMVGHFGAPTRLSYTALGDGVNLAARLEGLCKQYGLTILVSETIEKDARGAFVMRLIDRVAVKGKKQPVNVYELLGAEGEPIPRKTELLRYEDAFDAYAKRDFRAAIAIASAIPEDGPSRVLCKRCEALIERPPPEDWDGVYVASSK